MAIVTSGSVAAGGKKAEAGELVLFQNDGEFFELAAEDNSTLLVLAGEPTKSPSFSTDLS